MESLISDVMTCRKLERMLSGKKEEEIPPTRGRGGGRRRMLVEVCAVQERSVERVVKDVVRTCREVRAKRQREPDNSHLSDDNLSQIARFTDGVDLEPYKHFFHYVPRLVNIVTLAEAFPMPGSGVTLPLDLSLIASRCTSAYYAPRRFAVRIFAF